MTASPFTDLRGYAAPFDRPARVEDGALEVVAPQAFDRMLASPRREPVDLRWRSHDDDAPLLTRLVELFADGYGLGFRAVVDDRAAPRDWLRQVVQRAAAVDQASVQFEDMERVPERVHGELCYRVVNARISHIALTEAAAYGKATGVWPMHLIDDERAPWRLQCMAANWQTGREAFRAQARRQSARAVDVKAVEGPRAIGRTVGGHIVMCASNGVLSCVRVSSRTSFR